MSFIAGKVSDNNAGVVLSLPSTIAISLFFIGLTRGAGSIHEVVSVIPFSLGASVFFVAIYVSVAQLFRKKTLSMILSSLGAFAVWLQISIPLALFNFQSLIISMTGYLVLVFLSHRILYSKKINSGVVLKYSFKEKLFRATLAGFIIALVVILSKTSGLLWGGIFSVFPAAYFSSLIIFHRARGSSFLFNVSKTIPLGSPIFIIYALTANYFFPLTGIFFGTAISYLISLLLVIAYIKFFKF